MVFHIGTQTAEVVNNVGRDQYNQYGSTEPDARDLVRQLRAALTELDLSPTLTAEVRAHLDDTEADLSGSEPDKPRTAERLNCVANLLVSAGAVITAATPLGAPLAALARWLGATGQPIRDLIAL